MEKIIIDKLNLIAPIDITFNLCNKIYHNNIFFTNYNNDSSHKFQ